MEFALFLTNEENQLGFSKLAPVFPSQTSALNSEYFSKNSDELEQKVRYLGSKSLQNSVKPITIQKNHAILNELVDNMTQKVLLNKENLEFAIENTQAEWDKE